MSYLKYVVLLLMLTSCGSGPLKLDKATLTGKKINFLPTSIYSFKGYTLESYTKAFFDLTASTPVHDRARFSISGDISKTIMQYDPSNMISGNIKDYFIKNFSVKESQDDADYTVSYDQAQWGMYPHPILVNKYYIYYRPTLTITEKRRAGQKNAKSISFWCNFKTDSDYLYDDLFAKEAAAIKLAMVDAEKKCTKEFINEITDEFEGVRKSDGESRIPER